MKSCNGYHSNTVQKQEKVRDERASTAHNNRNHRGCTTFPLRAKLSIVLPSGSPPILITGETRDTNLDGTAELHSQLRQKHFKAQKPFGGERDRYGCPTRLCVKYRVTLPSCITRVIRQHTPPGQISRSAFYTRRIAQTSTHMYVYHCGQSRRLRCVCPRCFGKKKRVGNSSQEVCCLTSLSCPGIWCPKTKTKRQMRSCCVRVQQVRFVALHLAHAVQYPLHCIHRWGTKFLIPHPTML